jgi:hypothetical protein
MPGQTERPTLDYAVVCDDVRFETGDKISLMGVFDAIKLQSFPTVNARLAVVAAWMDVPGEVKSEIELVDPFGNVLRQLGAARIQQKGARKGARHIAVALNIPFNTPGIYQIRIILDGKAVRNIPIPVESVSTPAKPFSNMGKLSDMA